MRDEISLLKKYHDYLEQFISQLEKYSDDIIIEKFLQEKEKNKVSDIYQAIRLMRGNIYQSRNISAAILQLIDNWKQEQKIFFTSSIQSELQSLETVFRGFSHVIPQANLPVFGEGGLYFLLEGSEVLLVKYKIIHGYFLVCEPLFNRLDEKIQNEINPILKQKNQEVDQLIKDLQLYKGEASSRKTKEIYKKKYVDYKKTVDIYELYIMLLVCLSVTLVLGQLFAHSFFDSLNVSNAVMIKLTIIALIATLFAYCFKQISFYRKISEQAHQTYLELEALPEFLTHLPVEKQNEIRAELAKCYFGQNLFDSIKEDSASIQEQAKANTEVLKSTSALLDVIKKQSFPQN
ncbi:hypothetical protein E0H80_02390 [Acinetobacter sp. ANC 4779]|uniref:hypothetical protein n=1 Tax=Acinetobacter sp. ANC 4779 TaxID=2529848 RepID=UPI00104023F4|nr:hypothetical protein [Acinetobacter sp. ANC 4779]TCB52701.1 hypothetical protein E0H80_02390 [Acinetobacter sp. ANC 4779]